jgi:hypothetical protein
VNGEGCDQVYLFLADLLEDHDCTTDLGDYNTVDANGDDLSGSLDQFCPASCGMCNLLDSNGNCNTRASWVQLSKVTFYDAALGAGNVVNYISVDASVQATGHEGAQNLLDDSASTKYCPPARLNNEVGGVRILFEMPTETNILSFTWTTANDGRTRDPVQWRLWSASTTTAPAWDTNAVRDFGRLQHNRQYTALVKQGCNFQRNAVGLPYTCESECTVEECQKLCDLHAASGVELPCTGFTFSVGDSREGNKATCQFKVSATSRYEYPPQN